MAFIRPELRALFHRFFSNWTEVYAVIFGLWFGLWLLWEGIRFGAITPILAGLAALAVTGLAFYAFRQRARFPRGGTAPGVIEVTEHRIGYLSAEGGGFVDLDALTRLEVITTDDGPFAPDVFWVFIHDAGPPLLVPTEAEGSDILFDALASLPGISWETALTAFSSTEPARFLVWEKHGAGPVSLTLKDPG